ncbi:GNAT family N-acetyltransferase [Faecalibacter rhinopitheci]|uniref:GNAT family N-acetyltransferase n=1 Tax=Faecalibacter rhinopitheci TaxID=2779678 RepID=A0A8J7K3T5_9FLAO|nr:GNAT family N-acetyltransferase [Faecalibacter rhinopitheci]MBF0596554.1 GNAT family N-acetyltransferase [Faecalibacter rhinopitheci]
MEGKVVWHYKLFDELMAKELYQIIQLRNEVFVIEQDCIYQDADGKDLKCGHLWATINDEVVAYSRIVPKGISYENEPSIGRVVSRGKHRGLGLGKHLIANSIQVIENRCFTSSIRISAQLYLKKFYESFEFEQVSKEYLEDDIPHIEMLRK